MDFILLMKNLMVITIYAQCVFWEDDPIQLEDNEYEGGANRVSLVQARHNFLSFGACEEEMKKHVRKPKEDELNGID